MRHSIHSSTGSAVVTSRSLTIDLTKNKPPGVSTHRPPSPSPHFELKWREGLLGLGLAQGTSCSTRHFWGGWVGNRCLQHPFSLVLNPTKGWGEMGILLDLAYLTKDIQVIPATWMCESCSPFSTGTGTPLEPCAETPHPMGYPVGGFYPCLPAFSLLFFSHQSSSDHLHFIFHSSHGLR